MAIVSFSFARAAQFALLAMLLAGCGGNQLHHILNAYASEPIEGAHQHSLMVVTTRAVSEEDTKVYGGARGSDLGYARVEMSVPPGHVSGTIERPSGKAKADPAQHFAATRVGRYRGAIEFEQDLRERIKAHNGHALIFIHGYRTHFDDAVYRATQIIHDSGYSGAPVLFSWASAGRTFDYIYDNNSATIARDGLEATLDMLVDAGATSINIVAHSMGNWVLMEALRQTAIRGDERLPTRLGDVVMASPDIDVDVFKSQLRAIGTPENSFIVLVSRDDRALQASGVLAGNLPRLGDYGDAADLAALGVTVVDVSGLESGDGFNHSRFADNPLLIELLGAQLDDDDRLADDGQIRSQRLQRLTQGFGQTVGTAAEIIITTPLEIIELAIGQD